ncbi:Type IV pilus biogenesis protein PilP [Photobacterium marinum]|uniref:Type IV pilus biogenesis protein PilP n=1 Tax=Photobacterium marinum TaxID=1056511 RepID=L8J6W8_9GAMM|nr:pilus assembly protein PilP [Photobacterium marinum]ELR63938.1 Type IV pilus biogenesis protein PilP [Photobacterium marinum]
MHRYGVIMLAGAVLLGCQANEEPMPEIIANVHDEASARVEPLDEQYEFVADEFVMTSSRVPFLRPRPELAENSNEENKNCWQPNLNRKWMELERYPLEQLRMKGTLGGGEQCWALIYTPEGKLLKIHEGHYIGLNRGKVLRVSPKGIEIEEVLPDGTGCWLKRAVTLSLMSSDSAV